MERGRFYFYLSFLSIFVLCILSSAVAENSITSDPSGPNVKPGTRISYVINFENITGSVVPNLRIRADLDNNFERTSLSFGQSSPNDFAISFDEASRTITWKKDGINLAPNTSAFVTFSAILRDDAMDAYTLTEVAYVDDGSQASTFSEVNFKQLTIDASKPLSYPMIGTDILQSTSFPILFTAYDLGANSEVKSVALYYAEKAADGVGKPLTILKPEDFRLFSTWFGGERSFNFTGTPGYEYYFYTIATDNVGNVETKEQKSEASVYIEPICTIYDVSLVIKDLKASNKKLVRKTRSMLDLYAKSGAKAQALKIADIQLNSFI
ncbi:MAG: hypothetical protein GYA55_02425, partial [SAR324 cluster bacterium]|nr:hypothetical protein [SAR324 cluster bacterium]